MIDSLIDQTDRRFELIVVDQNGDDRLLPYLQRGLDAGLEIHHLRINQRGLSLARNRGLQLARFPWVGFPDDDCWYELDLVASVLARAETAAVVGLVADWVERGQHYAAGSALQYADWRNFKGEGGSSITLFVQTDCLRAVGGFDEHLGVGARFGAAEETDLMLRLLGTEARIEHFPQARVHHAYGVWVNLPLARLCRQSRMRGRGTGALYAKHAISLGVVLRGCLGPLVQPWLRRQGWRAAISGWVTVFGRLEGMYMWARRDS